MTTKTFNIPALSPIVKYEPTPDLPNAVWNSDQGGSVNGNVTSGKPARILQGNGRVSYKTFGTGLGISGALSGDFCTYSASLERGEGNSQDISTLPGPQTTSPASGMLAQFTGLAIDNWEIKLEASCAAGASALKVFGATAEGWIGNTGDNVSNSTVDDMSTSLEYSNSPVDWSDHSGLSATFFNDTQHYTSVNGAHMNFTFSGTAIVVYGSNDPLHGEFTTNLIFAGDPYDSQTPVTYSGFNPFLAVPVPIFLATGLDPTKQYTLIIENQTTNGTYLDLDYLEVYTSNGGPPAGGGGSNIMKPPPSKSSNKAAIIGGAVGGAALLLLLIFLLAFFWKRRKTKVADGGVRPLDEIKANSMGHIIPLQLHGHMNMSPTPYTPPAGPHSFAVYQRVPHGSGSFDGGFGSPTLNPHNMVGAYPTSSSISSYDPYAAYGGNPPSHPGSTYTGTNTMVDPVMARRQGKAAEIEAARMRVSNQGGSTLSPSTAHPTSLSTTTPSLVASSNQDSATPIQPADYKTPHDPPPSYQ